MLGYQRLGVLIFLASSALSAHGAVVVDLQQFDSACGHLYHNCRMAFQKALTAAADAGGGSIHLPAGTFFVSFPEVPNDVASGPPLQKRSIICVPSNVTIEGHVNSQGVPDSIIEWRTTSIPIFVFANASYSGMKNLWFRFVGVTPNRFPYGDVALLRALGYNPTFPHLNQMSGGNYEMFSVIMLFGSEHCTFHNLVFDSAVHDNRHVFGFAMNLKGKGVVVAGGQGGLNSTALDNQISNVKIYDFVMGLLLSGQENLSVYNITGDRRGSTRAIAPGHLIYFTGTSLFDGIGVVKQTESANVTVKHISEGPHAYSNIHALGTLAIKYVNGGDFQDIVSHHPVGLIQVLVADQNLSFEGLKWSNDQAVCKDAESFCHVPVIQSAVTRDGGEPLARLSFRNVFLESKSRPISINLMGKDITVNTVTIRTSPAFRKGQRAGNAIFSVRRASDVHIQNYDYVPLLTLFSPKEKYNQPFVCWGECFNVHANVTIIWPKAVALPKPADRVVSSCFQVRNPDGRNSIVSEIRVTRN